MVKVADSAFAQDRYSQLRDFLLSEVHKKPNTATTNQIVESLLCHRKVELEQLGFPIASYFLHDIVLRQLKHIEKDGLIKSELFNAGKVRHYQNYSWLSWWWEEFSK